MIPVRDIERAQHDMRRPQSDRGRGTASRPAGRTPLDAMLGHTPSGEDDNSSK